MERVRRGNAVQKVCRKGAAEMMYRNGRESRKMLPLWKEAGKATPSRRSVERVRRKMMYRNGSESRKTLPLWKGAGEAMLSRESVAMV